MNISSRTAALMRKELFSWIHSPVLYGVTVFFLLFVSIWFYYLQRFFAMNTATLGPFFSAFPFVFILVIPVLTMKAWAEERKMGSDEILLTMPFTEWELVGGKFLSCLILLAAMLLLTLPIPLSLLPLGNFDPGVICTEYTGVLLLGACAIAIGLFLSSVSKAQGAAFVGTIVVLLLFTSILGILANRIALPPFVMELINYLSLSFHFESFSRGLLDSRDISFFLLAGGLFLFLNTQVLIYRKWN